MRHAITALVILIIVVIIGRSIFTGQPYADQLVFLLGIMGMLVILLAMFGKK